MKVLLYTVDPPQGRCLSLAQQLQLATNLPGSECIQIAQRIFANDHPRSDLAIVSISESLPIGDLEATCNELGILMECTERQELVIPG